MLSQRQLLCAAHRGTAGLSTAGSKLKLPEAATRRTTPGPLFRRGGTPGSYDRVRDHATCMLHPLTQPELRVSPFPRTFSASAAVRPQNAGRDVSFANGEEAAKLLLSEARRRDPHQAVFLQAGDEVLPASHLLLPRAIAHGKHGWAPPEGVP